MCFQPTEYYHPAARVNNLWPALEMTSSGTWVGSHKYSLNERLNEAGNSHTAQLACRSSQPVTLKPEPEGEQNSTLVPSPRPFPKESAPLSYFHSMYTYFTHPLLLLWKFQVLFPTISFPPNQFPHTKAGMHFRVLPFFKTSIKHL